MYYYGVKVIMVVVDSLVFYFMNGIWFFSMYLWFVLWSMSVYLSIYDFLSSNICVFIESVISHLRRCCLDIGNELVLEDS